MYKLYGAFVASRLKVHSSMLEAASENIEELKQKHVWKYQPALITDFDGNVLELNEYAKGEVWDIRLPEGNI